MIVMRELKFRFWTPDKRMIDDHDGWVADIGINAALKCSREYGYIAMQFTGLKDRKGKEIYEGDIVEVRREDGGAWSKPEIWAVKYEDSSADFRVYNPIQFKSNTPFYALHSYQMFEVIGNIHENPEILTT